MAQKGRLKELYKRPRIFEYSYKTVTNIKNQ